MWTDAVTVCAVWVRRRGGPLLVPFDAPELTIFGAIARGWHLERRGYRRGGWCSICPNERERWQRCRELGHCGRSTWLLLPDPPEFLPTYPMPTLVDMPAGWWWPHDPRPLIVTVDPNYL